MKTKRIMTVLVACLALMLGAPAAANAATYSVSGQLNAGGQLVQYSTFRSHTRGTAGLRITENVSGTSRFGLRNTSGSQVTSSLSFTSPSYQSWGTVAAGRYALNGRMISAHVSMPVYQWRGTLTL
ncbi:hypothetical protein [Bifidobacterium callimiconis]|uniref:Uncharacterized protein n=1 Tax=Bifidobacterium callimiconis TaxID=2306973 RepID=A0A430FC23_9BIFI|nr:hypothetical protein [Bifidobacterium callimiconis]MBT1177708.1 hypothetical protein [Bifidobacterium callimiconis]RSX50383.1 hypothetical protein D2E23_1706 [Bifidobacterium callimiconis]